MNCPVCGAQMYSNGKGQFACGSCGAVRAVPLIVLPFPAFPPPAER
ncbi:tRNA(Ile2) C34 agmatinyltransferase TiaS [Kitasatospora sp. MAA4]|nr:tRNA(Ile2) C34 agmatinyltransferase TiaS [Kitasatospora sp. MAA4]